MGHHKRRKEKKKQCAFANWLFLRKPAITEMKHVIVTFVKSVDAAS